MREIKFRAWDGEKFVTDGNLAICMDGQIVGWRANESNSWVLQQYTGLKDKNGKEIYEGDICKWGSYVGEVKWKQSHCVFWIHDKKTPQYYDRGWRTIDSKQEVIGNIYENPELLTISS